jgi:hypothetical protein
MNIEIEVETAFDRPLVVSATVLPDVAEAYIGFKKYKKPGEFKYEWILQYLSQDDLYELAKGILFVADHMTIEGENDSE